MNNRSSNIIASMVLEHFFGVMMPERMKRNMVVTEPAEPISLKRILATQKGTGLN